MAVMGVGGWFLVAFALRPALDMVLNPQSTAQQLDALPDSRTRNHIIDLNSLRAVPHPPRVVGLSPWRCFSFSSSKAVAEYFGSTLIQYVGLSGITDLAQSGLRQVVQQPVGFFQHNPVGRVMSAVINDIEQIAQRLLRLARRFLPPDFQLDRLRRGAAASSTGGWLSARPF